MGGYPPIVEQLRATCASVGVETRLSTIVRRIAWSRGAVMVEATNGKGKPVALRARAAIVTLPVGVLRATAREGGVAFDPDLSSDKREALSYLEMGHVVKVALSFGTAFWTTVRDGRYRDAAFFRSERGAFQAFWTQYPVRSELIMAWAGGPHATALADETSANLIDRALGEFGVLLGDEAGARRDFLGGFVHDWQADPFARGAYSYVTVGGADARRMLASPLDETLFFAGEATSLDGGGGTVNGAFNTGERAALELASALAR